ncbi:hypothetical protein FRC02_001564 [Tulasnella sp. 418]|nr:hypothetical protein FRC02_001564 [Tulasnella sp. 418]
MTYHDDLGLLNRSLLCALEDSITVEPRLNLVENDPTSNPYFADWLTNTCEEHTIRSTAYSIPSIPCNGAFGSALPVNPNDRLSLFSLPTTSQLVYPVNYARTHSASSMNDSADSQIGESKDMAADTTFGSVAGERGSVSPRETYLNQPLRRLASSPTPSSDFQTELEAVTKRPLLSEDSQPRVKLGQRFDGAASIPLSPGESSSLDGQTELETTTKSPFKVGRGTLSFTRRATRGTGKKIPLATVKATAERFRPRLCIKMSSQAEPTKVVIDEDLAEQLRPYVQESRYPSHTSKTKLHTYEFSPPAGGSCQEEICNDADDEGGAEDA